MPKTTVGYYFLLVLWLTTTLITIISFQVERRRSDCLENLANLEKQFAILRDQLYQEKVNHVEMQMSDLHGGRSQEYLLPLQQLNENLKVRTEVAGILKQYRLENIQHNFDSEEQAAKQHYEVCGYLINS